MKNTTTTLDSNMQFVDLNRVDRFRTPRPRVADKRQMVQNRATTVGDHLTHEA